MASVGTPARTRASTLGIRVNLGFFGTSRLLFLVRRCALMILEMVRFTKAAGTRSKMAPPLFLCSFYWCVLYLHTHPRASPRTNAPSCRQREAWLVATQGVLEKARRRSFFQVSSDSSSPLLASLFTTLRQRDGPTELDQRAS